MFIDDIEDNCDAARELGIATVHFVDNEQAIPEIRALLRLTWRGSVVARVAGSAGAVTSIPRMLGLGAHQAFELAAVEEDPVAVGAEVDADPATDLGLHLAPAPGALDRLLVHA